MSQALTTETEHAMIPTPTDDMFKEVSSSGEWLPRLQLCTSSCDLCKEGLIGIGKYAIVRRDKDFTELDNTINVLFFAWKPQALDMNVKPPIVNNDPSSDEFKDIKARSAVQNSRCMFGPAYLVYVPGHGFSVFFMGSASARQEATSIHKLFEKKVPITLSSDTAENEKHKWKKPVGSQCPIGIEPPPQEEIDKALNLFMRAQKRTSETVAGAQEGEDRR